MAAEVATITHPTIPYLGPRPVPAASYFKRVHPLDEDEKSRDTPPDSDLLKSIKRVVRPSEPHVMRHSRLYPCHEVQSDEYLGLGQELSWNSNCVVLSTGSVILRKWTIDHEGQDIRWACKGSFMEPGGVVEGVTGSFSTTSSNDAGSFLSFSQSTFSRFAQSAQARQRAMEPPKRLQAVYVFLRNIGRIFVEGGGDYTFHIPFLVRHAWPLRPHGVLIEREMGEMEIREAIRLGTPLLPTLFSLHDPFSEPKIVGVAAKIHGALGQGPSYPTAITPADPFFPPETRTPEDFAMSGGYKPVPVRPTQTEGPPPPLPKRERPPPLQKPPPTDQVLWVSEEITSCSMMENLVVSSTLPLSRPAMVSQPSKGVPASETLDTTARPTFAPDHHRYSHQMHLTLWRYAYFKPREVPDPIPSKHRRPEPPSPTRPSDVASASTASVAPMQQPRDPEADRGREMQDRADRIPQSSPDVSTPPTDLLFLPPLASGTNDAALPFAAPRQPIGTQPTLASLPGGELPPSWGHPQPAVVDQGNERQGPQDRGRRPSLSVTMDRMVLGTTSTVPGDTEEAGLNQKADADSSTPTFMNAGHMKIQPSVWLEKIAAIPMPPKE